MSGYIGRGQPISVEDGSVETDDIVDGAVTAAKLAAGAAVPDQAGHDGQFLRTTTTGGVSTADWAALDTDANNTTKGLYEHKNTISVNYSITSGNNAMTAGPITINTGVSVTIPTGSTWVIA